LYNYADDNTLSKSGHSLATVIKSLEDDSASLISWFSVNKMQANPEKSRQWPLEIKHTNIIHSI
jgi:hypothetical protein